MARARRAGDAEPATNAANAQGSEPHAVTTASVREGVTDPCALLERTEIGPMFGGAVKEAGRMGQSCRWKPESGPGC